MTDIIKEAKALASLGVPRMRAEVSVHEEEDPRHADDCLVQIIEKDDSSSIWYEEEHGGYEYGELHCAHVFAAAPEMAVALAQETWEYAAQVKRGDEWHTFSNDETHAEQWWPNKSDAEEDLNRVDAMRETRIVRRRVSEPEVIE